MPPAVHVKGLAGLSRACKEAGRDAHGDLKDALKDAAEPVRRDSENLSEANITNIGPKWSAMRVGVTRRVVYVAPKARAIGRGVGGRRRPNLAPLLMREMTASLERNKHGVERAAEHMLATLGREWARGG